MTGERGKFFGGSGAFGIGNSVVAPGGCFLHVAGPDAASPCGRRIGRPAGQACVRLPTSWALAAPHSHRHVLVVLSFQTGRARLWLVFHFLSGKSTVSSFRIMFKQAWALCAC